MQAAKQYWTWIDFIVKHRVSDRLLTSRTTEENAGSADNSFQIDMLLKIICLAYGTPSGLTKSLSICLF